MRRNLRCVHFGFSGERQIRFPSASSSSPPPLPLLYYSSGYTCLLICLFIENIVIGAVKMDSSFPFTKIFLLSDGSCRFSALM